MSAQPLPPSNLPAAALPLPSQRGPASKPFYPRRSCCRHAYQLVCAVPLTRPTEHSAGATAECVPQYTGTPR